MLLARKVYEWRTVEIRRVCGELMEVCIPEGTCGGGGPGSETTAEAIDKVHAVEFMLSMGIEDEEIELRLQYTESDQAPA